MTRIFLDTGVLVALAQKKDAHHLAASGIMMDIAQGTYTRVVSSDSVLAETWNFIARKVRRAEAAALVREIVFGSEDAPPAVTDVLRVHASIFAAARERYQTEFSRRLSFTDWTSVVLMEEHRIDTMATFDQGFRGMMDVVPGTGGSHTGSQR